jgi:hypothetical protein
LRRAVVFFRAGAARRGALRTAAFRARATEGFFGADDFRGAAAFRAASLPSA